MAWWDKAISAVKSAVSKAVSSVEKVASAAKEVVVNSVRKVTSSVREVTSSVRESVSKSVQSVAPVVNAVRNVVEGNIINLSVVVAEKIEAAKDFIKKEALESVEKSAEDVRVIEAERDAQDDAAKEKELIELQGCPEGFALAEDMSCVPVSFWEKIGQCPKGYKMAEDGSCVVEDFWEAPPTWIDNFKVALRKAAITKLPFLSSASYPIFANIYEKMTGKKIDVNEASILKARVVDWIIPINAISKLLTGRNLEGEVDEFGGKQDNIELASGLLLFAPVLKIGGVAAKLGAKGFIKMFAATADDAVKVFRNLNVAEQTKMLRGLLKTDDGVKIINNLLARKSLDRTLVKPTISLVNNKIRDGIVVGSGFSKVLRLAAKPKTILWGLSGMLGAIGMGYSVAFGTEWFAKEGLWEVYDFPLGDRMRDYRFEPTLEKAERIQKDIAQLENALPKAQGLIRSIAWLWPPTKDAWLEWAAGIEFELEQRKDEFASIIIPELIELPEEIEVPVRDILDGDTIDVALEGTVNGNPFKLPEFERSNHARIRIVGINSPEKSPKGEIVCTGLEITNVEKVWADESRKRLLPLNEKMVTLKIDPDKKLGTFGRILAVVERSGEDIGLRQLKEGLACHFFREKNKFVDDDEYLKATLTAKEAGVGMWKGLENVEREEDKIKISIKTSPSNAKLFLDDVALHHNSPSDEEELNDVINLFTPGPHILSAEKGGISAMIDIDIKKGDNGEFELILETAPIVVAEAVVAEAVVAEAVVEEEADAVPVLDYTTEQRWALGEAFGKIWDLTKGAEVMSKVERETLIESFGLHTDGQKLVLLPLWEDLERLTAGNESLSKEELIELLSKYQIEMVL